MDLKLLLLTRTENHLLLLLLGRIVKHLQRQINHDKNTRMKV
jgi:hypothetical protein